MYNVFLSHAAEQAEFVCQVASALECHNMIAFVAGNRIPNGAEWLPSLEQALLTTDALAIFLTPECQASEWCDQEVGYALGRQRVVIPLTHHEGIVPHGFLAQYQAIDILAMTPAQVARAIFDTLYLHPRERQRLLACVLRGLLDERKLDMVRLWAQRLEAARGLLSPSEIGQARIALEENMILRTDRFSYYSVLNTLKSLANEG